jgi:hypothetical protein
MAQKNASPAKRTLKYGQVIRWRLLRATSDKLSIPLKYLTLGLYVGGTYQRHEEQFG